MEEERKKKKAASTGSFCALKERMTGTESPDKPTRFLSVRV
ncbi:hypothetical protein RchiOBHm_Chr4g0391581 [Rosa chinensis]|uniref:Uncharacterized protein n=1 Tax=Rosa chinensis TaxID=74649 RepID=A0A2P6QQH6_ROSCH|nr:hypothetical protein RchiOBHm_Chr4g0391581 [Rosa chinensis]